MNQKLNDIANLRSPSYYKPTGKGNVSFLKVSDFDQYNELNPKYTNKTTINNDTHHGLLQEGDILFASKGNRNFAWVYSISYGPAIASTVFTLIRPDLNQVMSEYLCFLLNSPQVQRKIQARIFGTNIPTLPLSEIKNLLLFIPSLKKQKEVIQLANSMKLELKKEEEIIRLKRKRNETLIHKILQN